MNSNNYQILSGSWLKVIAMVTMAIDHTASYLPVLYQWPELCRLMNTVGRVAFPVFAFLLVEGFIHTHDRKKYGRNLLVFAVVSQVPWALAHLSSKYWLHGNVGFTLLLGFLAMCIWEYMKEDRVRQTLALITVFLAAYVLKVDYNIGGVGLILLLYVLHEQKVLKLLLGTCIIARRYIPGVAAGFALLALYNGKRGFITGSFGKYLFYAFYPLHLLLLYLLRTYWLTT